MVGPTKRNPLERNVRDMARDTSVSAGTCDTEEF